MQIRMHVVKEIFQVIIRVYQLSKIMILNDQVTDFWLKYNLFVFMLSPAPEAYKRNKECSHRSSSFNRSAETTEISFNLMLLQDVNKKAVSETFETAL